MKERQSRLKAIKNLIKNNRIESQDDLLSLLLKEGFDVTQATLSRDLKLLKVGMKKLKEELQSLNTIALC